MWGIFFALSAGLKAVIDQFVIVALFGFTGNAVALVFFLIAKHIEKKNKPDIDEFAAKIAEKLRGA
jgi:hypothetical protein